jgi:hypothetical protein
VEHLIVRLAKENLRRGYYKIEGELTKLGFDISLTTVANVLGSINCIVRALGLAFRSVNRYFKLADFLYGAKRCWRLSSHASDTGSHCQ